MALPVFTIDGGPALILARAASVAMLLLSFGTAVFAAQVTPKALRRASADLAVLAGTRLHRLLRLGLTGAVVALMAWLVLQTADLAGAATPRAVLAATPAVIGETLFGRVLIAQLAAVALALVLLGRKAVRPGWWIADLTGAAVALQAGHSHALAIHGVGALLLSDVVHLIAAGAWLGGLPALLLLVVLAPPPIGAAAARWFTPLGKACVVAMIASAAFQFWDLIGGLPGLIGTGYGWAAASKILLLIVLLGFAAANRYRFAPALLQGEQADHANRVLIRSIAVQTGVGLLAVLAAATLSQLPPAIHEQPLWPLARRPSLVAMADPDLAWEVASGLLTVAAAIALLVVGAVWRRIRWVTLAGALALAWIAAPHFDLLFVEAYPTSYYHSPTRFAAAAIAHGANLYPANCAACHGADGKGDGPAAAGLAEPPADLTAAHLWEHEDGELFWWLSHGMEAPDGGMVMPGFAQSLSADDRWDLIDYIRARNAGVSMRDTGAWPRPVQAPALSIACTSRTAQTTSDLHGDVLHVIATTDPAVTVSPAPEAIEPGVRMVTVVLTPNGAPAPPDTCASTDPAAWAAMASVAGLAPDALAGAQFLVDADGWLRAEERPGESVVRWADPLALLADARAICAHRIASAAPGGHVHH